MMFIVLGPSKQSNDVVPRARRRTSSGELVMTMGQYSGIEVRHQTATDLRPSPLDLQVE